MKTVSVGLIGWGTVGSGVAAVWKRKAALFEDRNGVRLVLKRVCDLDIVSARDGGLDPACLTTRAEDITAAADIDIVVELIGGIHPAKEIILDAIRHGKQVVTANKALLAEEGQEIFSAARAHGVDVYFEASVGGGIPIIKALREGFAANRIERVYGIINGTANYILSAMAAQGCDFAAALRQAQERGFAERDPALDINGSDAAHKICILGRLCFGQHIACSQIYTEGIQGIEHQDIQYAAEFGYCVKLLAIAKRAPQGIDIRVHPTLLPQDHLLAHVQGVYNAVFVDTDLAGETLFYGQGAGKYPTASAVLSDIIAAAERIASGRTGMAGVNTLESSSLPVCSMEELHTRCYIRFSAVDEPGVLAEIARILGSHTISIHSVMQKGRADHEHAVPIVMMTHTAREHDLRLALNEMDRLPFIKARPVVIREERDGGLS